MNPIVYLKVSPLCEKFPTNFTLERLDALMGPDVNFQTSSS